MTLGAKEDRGFYVRHRWFVITVGAILAVVLLASPKRSIISYLLSPLIRYKHESLRER